MDPLTLHQPLRGPMHPGMSPHLPTPCDTSSEQVLTPDCEIWKESPHPNNDPLEPCHPTFWAPVFLLLSSSPKEGCVSWVLVPQCLVHSQLVRGSPIAFRHQLLQQRLVGSSRNGARVRPKAESPSLQPDPMGDRGDGTTETRSGHRSQQSVAPLWGETEA